MKFSFSTLACVFLSLGALAQVYVPGDHNGWALDGSSQATLKTNLGGSAHYGYTLTPTATQGFKVVNGAWGTDWGGGYWITGYDQRWTPGWQGGNAQWQGAPGTVVHICIENPAGYTGGNIPLGIMTLSGSPVSVSGSQIGNAVGVNYYTSTSAQSIPITVTGAINPEEKIYVRYTTDGWATDNFALATGAGASWSATIPGQSSGTVVEYYVLTTTLAWSAGNDLDNYTDLMTIEYDVNSGSNWTYTASSDHISVASGNWGSPATWLPGTVPTSASNVTITNGHTVTCTGGDAASLDVQGLLTHSSGTITIHGGGDMDNGGGIGTYGGSGTATIYFNAGGTVSGVIDFNNLWLGGGGMNGNLANVYGEFALRSGGFVTLAPNYMIGSTLNYWTGGPYSVSNEWDPGSGAIPHHVTVTNTTLDLTGGTALYCRNLTIESGGTVNLSTNFGQDLGLLGDLTVTGSLNDNDRAVVFDGDNQTVTSTSVLSLSYPIVEVTGAVTIAPSSANVEVTKTLRLSEGSLNTNGKLILKSDASGTALIDDFSPGNTGTISGNVVSQRYIGNSGFHFLAPQMVGSSTATFTGINWTGPNGQAIIPIPACSTTEIDPTSPYGNAFLWSESGPFPTNCFQEGWIVKSAGSFTAGRGFAATLGPATISQTGTPNTGNVTYGGLQNTPNSTSYGGGHHMIANPYCSPVVWSPGDMTNIAGFIQLWVSSGTYAGTYSPAGNGTVIASGQAFFANVTTSPGSINFSNSQRSTALNPTFYREPAKAELEVIVKGDVLADRTIIRLADDAINGFDYDEDAQKLIGDPQRPTLYSVIDGERVSYNSLNAAALPEFVDLVFTTGEPGEYTLVVNGLEPIISDRKILLLDKKTDELIALSKHTEYAFHSYGDEDEPRFRLIFDEESNSTQFAGSEFSVYQENGNLQILGLDGSSYIRVMDISGKTVVERSTNTTGSYSIDVSDLKNGLYLVNVNNTDTKKLVIN